MHDAAIVARRYYLDDKTKLEIADELGISRFKVARLLDEARATGIVRITISMPTDIDLSRGEAVASAFGIARALVVPTLVDDPAATIAAIGTAAAEHLAQVLTPGDVLGISWGTSVTAVVDAVTELPRVDVVQLVGGLRAADMQVSGDQLVRRLVARSGGQGYPLHAPLTVQSPRMAAELRADPSLAETIDQFSRLTAAVVGVGSWRSRDSALLRAFTKPERDELARAGAIADVCARVLDADGQPIVTSAVKRTVGIELDELHRVPQVIAVAGGVQKARAIAAAMRGGLVDTLVTDSATADALVSAAT